MKRIRTLFLLASLIFSIFLLTNSCVTKIVKTSENRKKLKLIIESINQYNEDIKSFKGNGYAILKDKKNTKTFKVEMIFSDDFINYRFLIKDFVFQRPIAILVKKEKEPVILYDYIKRVKSSYSNVSEIFKKVLNFDIQEGNIFIQSLGLRIPIINTSAKLIDANSVEFSFKDSKEFIHFTNGLPDKIKFVTGYNTMIIKYDKIVLINGKKFPSRVFISIGETSLEINYKNIDINGDYDAEIELKKQK